MDPKNVIVTVKKPDGSFARMTLAEARVLKNKPAPNRPSVARVLPDSFGLSLLPADRSDLVNGVLQKLSFKIGADLENRSRAAIQLFLKDVRTAEQTKERAMDRPAAGGLGLNEAQAEELMALAGAVKAAGAGKTSGVASLKGAPIKGKADIVAMLKELPDLFHEPGPPAVAAPFNSFIAHSSAMKKESKIPAPSEKNFADGQSKADETFRLGRSRSTPKAMVKDVVGAKPLEIGPVDEIRYLNLVDFRRLATDPKAAATRVAQKFENLRAESYLLFLQARSAWRKSPLFNLCMEKINFALRARRPLAESLTDKNDLGMAELEAIIQMEMTVAY